MENLKIPVTKKQLYLLERIAKNDDRRLEDLINLVFSTGLEIYFCERGICFEKDKEELTEDEKKQIKINKKLINETENFWSLTDDEQKKLGYKKVETQYSNYSSYSEKSFIDKLADEIRNNALKLIKEDYKDIEENIIKENTPKEDKIYSLVDSTNKKSIVNGNTWEQSEVENNDETK
jgi:hypothetical protein